jgi:hypothetical protein
MFTQEQFITLSREGENYEGDVNGLPAHCSRELVNVPHTDDTIIELGLLYVSADLDNITRESWTPVNDSWCGFPTSVYPAFKFATDEMQTRLPEGFRLVEPGQEIIPTDTWYSGGEWIQFQGFVGSAVHGYSYGFVRRHADDEPVVEAPSYEVIISEGELTGTPNVGSAGSSPPFSWGSLERNE